MSIIQATRVTRRARKEAMVMRIVAIREVEN